MKGFHLVCAHLRFMHVATQRVFSVKGAGVASLFAASGYRDQTSANEPQRGPHTLLKSCESVGLCIRHPELSDFVVSFMH